MTARAAYGRAVEAVRSAARGEGGAEAREALGAAARALDERLRAGDQELLALTARSTAGNHLYAHSVNVAILAMHIARSLDAGEERVLELGLQGLLHDLARGARLREASGGPLTEEEVETALHPVDASRLFDHVLELAPLLPESLFKVYDDGVAPESVPEPVRDMRRPVSQGAHLLALCDMYEAMSHHRNWREPVLAHEALMALLKRHQRETDQRLLKAFAERLTVFPPGSYVELSSGEFGRVSVVHSESPTRPSVDILAGFDGRARRPFLRADLVEQKYLHVVRAVDPARAPVRDLRLRLELAASRWWIR